MNPKFQNPQVAKIFASYPPKLKTKLFFLRKLIFDTASKTKGVGSLEETLRWGEPSYLTTQTKSGSMIRIDRIKSSEENYAMYFHCQTNLIATFKELFSNEFTYGGKRCIIFNIGDPIPIKPLRHCISLALTYNLRK